MQTMYRGSRLSLTIAAAALLGGVAACYSGEIDSLGELDLVLTFFDSTANFESIATYAMPDTIIRFDGMGGGDDEGNPRVDPQILAAVAAELDALGYMRIDETSATPPDVVVLLMSNRTDTAYWYGAGWWDYWGWYPGWNPWYPGWGGGYYPGYPWAPLYAGTQSRGSLLMTMIDPSGATGAEIPVIWSSIINGLFESSDASVLTRFRGLIRQAFDQSPYL
jgi:hypothetical protein